MTTMSADITSITDEDQLKRMWQQADDFSRKKEIRAHMYKLREQRLKEFYTTGEVLRDVQRSNSSPGFREENQKIIEKPAVQTYTKTSHYTRVDDSGTALTHADSLTDQSFLSLKSKEIRDSESPTRDISYRNQDIVRKADSDWKVITTNEKSEDGKTQTSSRLATTAGIREIDGGVNKFAAINEKRKFDHNDGDENNFVRTKGSSDRTCAEEHFVSGDDKNYQKSSTKTSSSSSRVVTHYGSTSETPEITEYGKDDVDFARNKYTSQDRVINKSRNNETSQNEQSNYETNKSYKHSTTSTSSTNKYNEANISSKSEKNDFSNSKVERDGAVTERVVKLYKSDDPNLPDFAKNSIVGGTTKIVTETRTLADGSKVTSTKYETTGPQSSQDTQTSYYTKSDNERRTTKKHDDEKYGSTKSTIKITKTDYDDISSKTLKDSYETNQTNVENKTKRNEFKTYKTEDITDEKYTSNKDVKQKETIEVTDNEPFDSVPKSPIKKAQPSSQDATAVDKDHYTTTYRQEYTNKRITVDLSPSHEAFAKSLRSSPERALRSSSNSLRSSPEKTSPTRRSNRFPSNETITKSHSDIPSRGSSPIKDYNPRLDRRSPSSKRTSKYDENKSYLSETTSTSRRYDSRSPNRSSPERTNSREGSPRKSIYTTDYCTDTIKRRKPVNDSSEPKLRRTPSPTKTPYSRETSPEKKVPARRTPSPKKQTPQREVSPTKQTPYKRDKSPYSRSYSPGKQPRESSPSKTYTRRTQTPTKSFTEKSAVETTTTVNTDTFTRRRSSPEKKNYNIKEPSPTEKPSNEFDSNTFTRNRKDKPTSSCPCPHADVDDIGVKPGSSTHSTTDVYDVSSTNEYTKTETKRKASGGILKKRPSLEPTITLEPVPDDLKSENVSPTSVATDIEFISHKTQIITDLDTDETITVTIDNNDEVTIETNKISKDTMDLINNERNVENDNLFPKQVPSASDLISPIADEKPPSSFSVSPEPSVADLQKEENVTKSSKTTRKTRPPFKRTETYEERCREILGITTKKSEDLTDLINNDTVNHTIVKKDNPEKEYPSVNVDVSANFISTEITNAKQTSEKISTFEAPEKESLPKSSPVKEFPAQRRSPDSSPDRKHPSKKQRKSPDSIREPDSSESNNRSVSTSPERKSSLKQSPTKKQPSENKSPPLQEFPSQRKSPSTSPERTAQKPLSQNKKQPTSKKPTIQEFPAQRRTPDSSPERKSQKNVPEKTNKRPKQFSPESSPERTTSNKKPNHKKPTGTNGTLKSETIITKKTREENNRQTITDEEYDSDSDTEVMTEEEAQVLKTIRINNENITINQAGEQKTTKNQTTNRVSGVKTPTKSFLPSKVNEKEQKSVLKKDNVYQKTVTSTTKTTSIPTKGKVIAKTPSKSSIKPSDAQKLESPTKTPTKTRHVVTATVSITSQKSPEQKTVTGKPVLPRRHTEEGIGNSKPKVTNTKSTARTTHTTVKSTTITKPTTLKKIEPTPKKAMNENTDVSISSQNKNQQINTNVIQKRLDSKVTRISSENAIKIHKSPVRGKSKPEISVPSEKAKPNGHTNFSAPDKTTPRKLDTNKKDSHRMRPDLKISTKTLILTETSENIEQSGIVDIQLSKSSREPSPEHIWPRPIKDSEDTGKPRHPDNVCEPDDDLPKRKPTKLANIPIHESEDLSDFEDQTITEISEDYPKNQIPRATHISEIDKVTETDECLLSVTAKVSKFLNTAESLTKPNFKESVAPKVPRPELNVEDEELKEDECLLSVSDKVNKFLATADQVTQQKPSEKPKSKIVDETYEIDESIKNDECLLSVHDKVNRFASVSNTQISKQKTDQIAPKVNRPDLTNVDEELKTDECLLSVTDKINKFLTTEQITCSEETQVKENIYPEKPSDVPQISEKDTKKEQPRRPSPIKKTKESSPVKEVGPKKSSPDEAKTPRKASRDEVKSSRKPSLNETDKNETTPRKSIDLPRVSKTNDTVKKARAMFETISSTTQATPKQRDILSRPSIWEARKEKEAEKTIREDVKLTDIGVYETKTVTNVDLIDKELQICSDEKFKSATITDTSDSLKSTKLILNNTYSNEPENPEKKEQVSPPKSESPVERYKKLINQKTSEQNLYEKTPVSSKTKSQRPRSKSPQKAASPAKQIPSKADEPDAKRRLFDSKSDAPKPKDSVTPNDNLVKKGRSPSPVKKISTTVEPSEDTDVKTTKFGVILKRTDSSKAITNKTSTVTVERRRSSSTDPSQQVCIEDIEDLALLEQMLEKVVGYEQRRRIRAQIRLVKKLISEGKLMSSSIITIERKASPTRTLKSDTRRSKSPEKTMKKDGVTVEKSYMRQTLTSEVKHAKPDSEQIITTNKQPIENHEKNGSYSTTVTSKTTTETNQVQKKYRSPSPKTKRRTPSPEKRVQKTSDYQQSTTSWSQKSSVSVTNKSDLRKVPQKSPTDDKPEWVTQKILRKVNLDNTPNTQRRVTNVKTLSDLKSKKEETKEISSRIKEVKPTDCITSSYGIGPTDENGRPLFGIRALRHQASFNDKVEVRGTVVSSSFYSENGSEPVGEISVTEYSTNPSDLGEINDANGKKIKGMTSVTTTQKFGDSSNSSFRLKAISDKSKESSDDMLTKNNVTARISRRGSVKELSKKFIENTVETIKSERQSTYPKAGLILRTSSFKDTQTGSDLGSRASTPAAEEFSKTISLESMDSNSDSYNVRRTGKSFLNSQSRVTGVQDVLVRMKNAETDVHIGDTDQDSEARALLNKFLGAQVLMTGMDPLMNEGKHSSSTAVERRTIVKTSKQESGSPQVTAISHFTRPVTLIDIEDVWDERVLKLLLETSNSYEERRIIRARIRQVMAEQEACANIVASAVAEVKLSDSSSPTSDVVIGNNDGAGDHQPQQIVQGESLLLPLLREILDKQQQSGGATPHNNTGVPLGTTVFRTNSSQSSDESGQTSVGIEDSGTESGEDLRLLAAGLCDSIEQHRVDKNTATPKVEPLGPGLLSEVISALNRLQTSLQLDSNNEMLDSQKKLTLLQLITRLQTSLVPATVLPPVKPVEKTPSATRFSKRKERKNRHTVGVSSEELADARRLMEEMVLRDTITKSVSTSEKIIKEGPSTKTQVTTTRITTQQKSVTSAKSMSPFAKFRQLDKQNSQSSAPSSPKTPGGGSQPLFKFTDPALSQNASTVKDRLLYWCQVKTKEYKNVQIENFSTSWANGLAFCALIHHFRPDAFDYEALTPQQRRHNFSLAFRVADEVAGIAPLLDVEDMVMMRKPDWKCVFTYVQSIYRRFKDEEI